jgi:RNA polymerase sigma-70 factor (ECF subfamily)
LAADDCPEHVPQLGRIGGRSRDSHSFEDEPAIEAQLTSPDAHTLLLKEIDIARLKDGIESLPHDAREAIVLREIEGLSYKEISEITRVPIGTVMSRLARARSKLQKRLNDG